MTRLRIAASLAAALSLPCLAGPVPSPDPGIDLDFYTFDIDDMVAQAQPAPPAPPPPPMPNAQQWREYGERMREWAQDYSTELQGSLALTFSDHVARGKVVKGAPYSAEAVSERRQTLADGNVISHESRSRVYRDGEGRTRQDTMTDSQIRSVYISDPVAGVTYTLIPSRKLAVVSKRPVRVERDRTSERGVTVERDQRVIVTDKDGTPGTREEVHVRVMRGEGDQDLPAPPTPPVPPIPPIPNLDFLPQVAPLPGTHTMHFEGHSHAGPGVTKKVGPKEIEGVKAEGTQTTWTIAPGKVGNSKPIDITRETWTSPDLQVTVYSRYNDPRTGESIYRLAAIKRAEPAADLFKLPEGYKVRERHGHGAPPAPPAPGTLPVPPAPPAPPAPPPPRG